MKLDFQNILQQRYPFKEQFLNALFKYRQQITDLFGIRTFVETGTDNGYNATRFSLFFNTVFTIEKYITEEKFYRYRIISSLYDNIVFLHGHSPAVLETILPQLPRSVIQLDAHAGFETCLPQELEVIQKVSPCKDHILLIDDTAFFGKGEYPEMDHFVKLVRNINPDYKIEDTLHGNGIYICYT